MKAHMRQRASEMRVQEKNDNRERFNLTVPRVRTKLEIRKSLSAISDIDGKCKLEQLSEEYDEIELSY